jgi:transcriptional antiterminator RfaH
MKLQGNPKIIAAFVFWYFLSGKNNIKGIFESIMKSIKMADRKSHTLSGGENFFLKKSDNKWYAIYTRPRAEKQVYERLVEAEIETFLPLQRTCREWSDRKKFVEKPLLSSYVFVKTNNHDFPKVYNTRGVVKFVTFEGAPASIPQKQIDNLRLLINSDAEIEISSINFAQGDNVEVVSGSLVGLTGELIKIGNRNRVVVRIDKLNQNLILKIPRTFLKKI